jgi:hypothetical protein
MPYKIDFLNAEEKASFDAWYAGVKSRYLDVEKRDAIVKEELERRGLTTLSTYIPQARPSAEARAQPAIQSRSMGIEQEATCNYDPD